MTKTISYSMVGFVLIAVFSCAPPETTVERYDLVVQGGRVMDPESGLDAVRNLGIRDGRIEEISPNKLLGNVSLTQRVSSWRPVSSICTPMASPRKHSV